MADGRNEVEEDGGGEEKRTGKRSFGSVAAAMRTVLSARFQHTIPMSNT